MASMKTHMLKALGKRRAAELAHAAELYRQAGIDDTARTLAAAAAAAAKMPATVTVPATPGGNT